MKFTYGLLSVLNLIRSSALQSPGTLSDNILAGKTSVQSSTYNSDNNNYYYDFYNNNYYSNSANDGNSRTRSMTGNQSYPYWQGDLGGYYNVTEITVTSVNNGWAVYLRGAVIEISTSSVITCPDLGTNVTCGRWPDADLPGVSITFNCSHTAVRYVRIRREVTDYLAIAEVKADGVPSILPGQQYDKVKSKKVTTPVKSFSVARVTECGTMCHQTQPCIAFSYSKDKDPNCLLATDTSMTTDAEWMGYKVNECKKVPTTCTLDF